MNVQLEFIKGFLIGAAINDFAFMGGSMGVAFGERYYLLAKQCIKYNLPFLFFSCSGGARMQEGTLALSQMGKTAHVTRMLRRHNIPTIAIVMHPTTGGVPSGPLFQFSVIIGQYNAMLSFAGPRVISLAGGELDFNVISTNYLSEQDMIDEITNRKGLTKTIQKYLKFYSDLNTDYAKLCSKYYLSEEE